MCSRNSICINAVLAWDFGRLNLYFIQPYVDDVYTFQTMITLMDKTDLSPLIFLRRIEHFSLNFLCHFSVILAFLDQ